MIPKEAEAAPTPAKFLVVPKNGTTTVNTIRLAKSATEM
jgi:hypothetical protein